MTAEQRVQVLLFAGAFLIAFSVGLVSSWRLKRRYDKAKEKIDHRNRLVLQVIVFAAWLITVAAGWFGTLSAIRLIFDVALPWTPPITLVLSTAIVLIPLLFDIAVSKVARIEDDD